MAKGKMGKKFRDPWEKLPPEFKEEAERADEAGLRKMVSDSSLNQAALMLAKEQDEDLRQKALLHSEASRMYREGSALNKLKAAYLRQMLDSKGCAVPMSSDFLPKESV